MTSGVNVFCTFNDFDKMLKTLLTKLGPTLVLQVNETYTFLIIKCMSHVLTTRVTILSKD